MKRRLRFEYNGKTRIVEPQCYGIGTKRTVNIVARIVRVPLRLDAFICDSEVFPVIACFQ